MFNCIVIGIRNGSQIPVITMLNCGTFTSIAQKIALITQGLILNPLIFPKR